MNLQEIIASLANRADDFLSDAKNAKEARTMIGELLAKEYPKLSGIDRQKVSSSLMEILNEEGFFDGGRGGDSWEEGADDADDH